MNVTEELFRLLEVRTQAFKKFYSDMNQETIKWVANDICRLLDTIVENSVVEDEIKADIERTSRVYKKESLLK